jgi:ParB-like chromosome segregation protein Spo0J
MTTVAKKRSKTKVTGTTPPAETNGQRKLRKQSKPATQETYQFFQPLSQEERDALKQDIEQRGIQIPIELDSSGVVLDGYHRLEIAKELGLPDEQIPKVVRSELTSKEQKITHVLKTNLLRRRHVGPITQARCVLALKEARGIDTSKSHNRHTARADTLSALWQELGLNERTGRRYLELYDEFKHHSEFADKVDEGIMTPKQARIEAGIPESGKKPKKKKSLYDGIGFMGFLEDVADYAHRQMEPYEERDILSHEFDSKNGKVILVITLQDA